MKVQVYTDFRKCRTRLVKIFITRWGYKYHMHTINECNTDKIKNYELKILSRIKCSIFNTLLSSPELTVCISIWKAHKNVYLLFSQPVFGLVNVYVMSLMCLLQIKIRIKTIKLRRHTNTNSIFIQFLEFVPKNTILMQFIET